MDFNYNENQKLISEMIRSFSAKEIVPNIKEWDDNQIFPVHVFKKLGELGLMGVLVPQEYGEPLATPANFFCSSREIPSLSKVFFISGSSSSKLLSSFDIVYFYI